MTSAKEHLDDVLKEYNDAVASLEGKGPSEEGIGAYIRRGRVLSMMESFVAAIDDFNQAIAMIRQMESSLGRELDPGYWVMAHLSRGELVGTAGPAEMAAEYKEAASRLPRLSAGCRFFEDDRAIAEMCVDAAGDLREAGFRGGCAPFIDKAISLSADSKDPDMMNLCVGALNFAAGDVEEEDPAMATALYSKSVEIGAQLKGSGRLRNRSEFVLALASLADLEEAGDEDAALVHRVTAVDVLEEMFAEGYESGVEALAELHGLIGKSLMSRNKVEAAEAHLMRQAELAIGVSEEYLEENGIKPWKRMGGSG